MMKIAIDIPSEASAELTSTGAFLFFVFWFFPKLCISAFS